MPHILLTRHILLSMQFIDLVGQIIRLRGVAQQHAPYATDCAHGV